MAAKQRLDEATRRVLASVQCQRQVVAWLETACDHLAEAGLECDEPKLSEVAHPVTAGLVTGASVTVRDPCSPGLMVMQVVLFAALEEGQCGVFQASIYVTRFETDEAGLLCNPSVVHRCSLFASTPNVRDSASPTLKFASDSCLVNRLQDHLQEAVGKAFRDGIGPHLRRFRLGVDQALTP